MKKINITILICLLTVPQVLYCTTLSELAESMAPGTWTELDTIGFEGGDFLFTTNNEPGTISPGRRIIDYAESGIWDPVSKKFMFLGAPHNNAWKFIVYDDASNTWSEGPMPFDCMYHGKNSTTGNSCGGHAFDLNAFNLVQGEFIWRYRNIGPEVYTYNIAQDTWSTIQPTNTLSGWTATNNKLGALEYFPTRNGLFSVVGGRMYYYDATIPDWERLSGVSMGNYHNFAEYNPVHDVILFGGGNSGAENSRTLYKMDSEGLITQMQDAPINMRIMGGEASAVNGTLVSVDPVSGQYLVLNIDQTLHEYNVISDTWAIVGTAPINSHAVAAPISNYGVVIYVSRNTVHLYKHSDIVDTIFKNSFDS